MSVSSELVYKGLRIHLPNAPAPTRKALEDAVLAQLLAQNVIPLPSDKVENEVNWLINKMQCDMRYDSLTTGTPHYFMQNSIDEQMPSIREEAERTVKTELLLQQIISQEHLQVTQDELDLEAQAMAVRQNISVDQIIGFFGKDLALLKGDLLVQKAIQLICDNAVISVDTDID